MLIDVTQTLKTLSGQVMKDVDENQNAIDATLRLAIVNALLAPTKGQESGVDKVKKYELAKKVYTQDSVELSAEDITLIKSRIGEVFQVNIVGQCFEMLEK
jgi:hypothetical protein